MFIHGLFEQLDPFSDRICRALSGSIHPKEEPSMEGIAEARV